MLHDVMEGKIDDDAIVDVQIKTYRWIPTFGDRMLSSLFLDLFPSNNSQNEILVWKRKATTDNNSDISLS